MIMMIITMTTMMNMMMNSKLLHIKQLLPTFNNIRPNLWLIINCNLAHNTKKICFMEIPEKHKVVPQKAAAVVENQRIRKSL
jgi:hypothetical protein